ncbi:MAG: DNA/RNA non-specific endonuclease [Muribaculaceae bacterium]|nr:DNA/RNA non-specific endonuclease [Muribaculaceae bacterium]
MMKKLGKFGIICIMTIVLVLIISATVDAKKKKKRNKNRYEIERFFEVPSIMHDEAPRYRFKDKNYCSNNVQPVSSNLTEVRINSHYSNVIKRYAAMTVNFNYSYKVPNCVSYVLTSDMIDITNGPNAEHRRNYKFYADPSVRGCPEWYEYRGSGYDRGHMAPANDMRWSRQSMSDCFLMTNICPQDHDLNGGSWNKLELKIHDWAKRHGKIIVATGPIFNGNSRRIGQNNDIVVPAGFFKVVLDPGRNRAIGFIYENHEGGGGVSRHACSVDEVERITGHDFFSALPDNVEQSIESTYNFNQWN